MSLTSPEADMVDEMNSAAGKAELGTEVLENQTGVAANLASLALLQALIQGSGEYAVDSDDDTANTTAIDTGVTINGYIVQIYRSGVEVHGDAAISVATTVLTVADGSTYVLTDGDVINYIVW